jgi:hypothetical protein
VRKLSSNIDITQIYDDIISAALLNW